MTSALLHAPARAALPLRSPSTPPRPDLGAVDLDALSARLATTAAAHDRDGSFPFENLAALHAQGLVAAVVPRSAGGGGATLEEARRIVAAVAKGEPSTALILTMTYLVHRAIGRADARWGPLLRDAVWQSAVTRGALVNNLRVEPELGSPARGGLPATVARRTPDGWRLTGHKLYTTGFVGLSWLNVWARTDEPEPRTGIFLVPREPGRDLGGLTLVESWDHLGLRASGSHEAIFDDVAIPLDHAVDIRPAAEWAGGPEPDQHAWMVVLLAALYDGVARAARDWLVGFLVERKPGSLGAPLASLPRVQQTVGEIEALLWANQALLGDLARRTDGGTPPTAAGSGLVKFNVTGNAVRAVDLALQLTGNHGLTRKNPLERHWRDVQCSRIHTPQNDSILLAAGRAGSVSAIPSDRAGLRRVRSVGGRRRRGYCVVRGRASCLASADEQERVMSGLGGLNKSPQGVVVGLAQLQLPLVETPVQLAAQVERICWMVGKARRNLGTMDLVVFPEYALQGLSMSTAPELMVSLDGPEVAAFKAACVQHRIWGCFSIMEANPHGHPYNTGLIIDDQGDLRLYYRKLHPWIPVEPWEPGNMGVPVCDGPNGSRIALIICHDGMFPEMAREAAYKGAEIILRTAGYTAPIRHAWKITNQANAFQNLAITASVCLCGSDGSFDSMGEAMFCNFDGTVIGEGGARPDEIVSAELRPDLVREARAGWGVENNIYQLFHRGYVAVQGGAQDCPYTFMQDMVAGRYRLPWDARIEVRDGTPCGFAAPTRRYAGAEPNPTECGQR